MTLRRFFPFPPTLHFLGIDAPHPISVSDEDGWITNHPFAEKKQRSDIIAACNLLVENKLVVHLWQEIYQTKYLEATYETSN